MTDPRPFSQNLQGVNAPGDIMPDAVARRYLSIEELSASTTLSISTLRRLYKQGLIVGYQPGGPRTRIVFPPDAIEQVSRATSEPPCTGTPSKSPKTAQRGPRPQWMDRS